VTSRSFVPVAAALWLAVFVMRAVAGAPVQTTRATADDPGASQSPVAASPGLVPPGPVQTPAGGYVGVDTCTTCHDSQSLHGTPHGRVADARTPMAQLGCESCHGPGKAHVDASGDPTLIRRFKDMRADDVNNTCTTCHTRRDHALWEGSAHQARNLSCVSCHSVHSPKSEGGQLVKANAMALCAQCHREKVAKIDRSGHMPVREGKMACVTCHNPHGTANVKLLRAGLSSAESCTSCHADKRGPFLFEHAPVRETCATCHDPHGSANDRMLVQKQPFMCQRCHSHVRHPGTLYDNRVVGTSNRIFSRSCVTCHAQVHGSNHPSGHFFLR
jgi:DmsE family decaheme c-type cytochrome